MESGDTVFGPLRILGITMITLQVGVSRFCFCFEVFG